VGARTGNCSVDREEAWVCGFGFGVVERAEGKSFRAPAAPELLSLCVLKEKVTKEKEHPAWRLPGIHARQVRESGPGFSNGHPARAKRSRRPVDSRYAACRPHLTAAQGPRVEQAARHPWRAFGAPPLRGGKKARRQSWCFGYSNVPALWILGIT
jgi:hypothetical protein